MKVEYEILLRDPSEEIDLNFICDKLPKQYSIERYALKHYILLSNKLTKSIIRVHEDGRVYVKMYSDGTENEKHILSDLIEEMNNFISKTYLKDKLFVHEELNFSFYGLSAQNYFWKTQQELKEIGKKRFNYYNMRTYSSDDESIRIKLEKCECV